MIDPGETIGSNVVIGSESVAAKEIIDHVVTVGSSCRVIRKITEKDVISRYQQLKEYEEETK